MATFYVDPTSATNGVGSFADPFNVWTSAWSAATASSSDVLLQKQGTTFSGGMGMTKNGASAAAPIIVGVYNATTGARVLNTRGAAKLNGAGATSIGMNMQDRYNVLVDGFEVYGFTNYGLFEGHSSGTLDQKHEYVTGMQFKNLYIHDITNTTLAAIWIQGSGVKYNNILIEDCAGDGLYHGGQCIGEDITIRRIDNTNGGLGDCLSHFYPKGACIWRRCILDHSNNSNKQCAVIGLTGVTVVNYTSMLIEDCEMTGNVTGSGLMTIVRLTGVTVRRCKFNGDKGIYVLDATSVVNAYSNLCVGLGGNTIGIGSEVNSTVNAISNTIVGHQRGIELLGINNTAVSNIVYSTGATPITAISKTNNYTNLNGDPGLDGHYRPTNSACIRTGTAISHKDFYGKRFLSTPNIGAIDDHRTPAWASVGGMRP